MKTNTYFLFLALLLTTILNISMVSCSKEEHETPVVTYYPDNTDNTDTGNNDRPNSESIEDIVSKNIISTISYSNYFWYISLSTSLGDKFPNKSILYGIEFGYGQYDTWFNSACKGNSYHYGYGASGSGNYYTLEVSVFDGSDGTYSNESFYVRQYVDLLEKQKTTTLDKDQRNLLNKLSKQLPTPGAKAKKAFTGKLYAEIDSKRYYFKNFTGNSY